MLRLLRPPLGEYDSDRLLIWDHSSSVKCGTSGFSVLCEAEQTAAEASKCDG
jgi:hypothetical protein